MNLPVKYIVILAAACACILVAAGIAFTPQHQETEVSCPVPGNVSPTVQPAGTPGAAGPAADSPGTPGEGSGNILQNITLPPPLAARYIVRSDGSETVAVYNRSAQARDIVTRPLHDTEQAANLMININSVLEYGDEINISTEERGDVVSLELDPGRNVAPYGRSIPVWLFSEHYLSVTANPVSGGGTIEYFIDRNVTDTITDTNYLVLFLLPQTSGQPAVTLDTTGCIVRRDKPATASGTSSRPAGGSQGAELFCMDRLAGTSGLVLADGFTRALDADKTTRYVKIKMNMSPDLPARPDYWMDIDPVGNHGYNETFSVTGRTNLPAGSSLEYSSGLSYFCPGPGCYYEGPSGTVPVLAAQDGNNTFSVALNGSAFRPDDEYVVYIEYPKKGLRAAGIFSILPGEAPG